MQLHPAGLIRVSISLFFLASTVYRCGNCHFDLPTCGQWEVKMCSRQEAEIEQWLVPVAARIMDQTVFTLIHCHLNSSPSDKVFWRALKVFSNPTLGEEEARIVTFQDCIKTLACNAAGMKHVLSIIEVYSCLLIHGCTWNRSSIRYRLELICLSEIISLTQLFVSTSPSPPTYISALLFLPMVCVYWVCACS